MEKPFELSEEDYKIINENYTTGNDILEFQQRLNIIRSEILARTICDIRNYCIKILEQPANKDEFILSLDENKFEFDIHDKIIGFKPIIHGFQIRCISKTDMKVLVTIENSSEFYDKELKDFQIDELIYILRKLNLFIRIKLDLLKMKLVGTYGKEQ
jgi:hypothetical protein